MEKATGTTIDFAAVTGLNTDFLQSTDNYLLLNIKEYYGEVTNNLLFLTDDRAYIFARTHPDYEAARDFAGVLSKPCGKSTMLAFLVLDKVIESHKKYLDDIISRTRQLEDKFEHNAYRHLVLEFESLNDRLEEFHDILLRLQETRYKEVTPRYIPFDYNVLIAESTSLQGRCRRRLNSLREIRQEHEMAATEELNQKVVKLNEVVKRLTALTVIMMLPTLIASHFGMNFVFMPELRIPWAYPAVIIVQVILMAISALIFRRMGWL